MVFKSHSLADSVVCRALNSPFQLLPSLSPPQLALTLNFVCSACFFHPSNSNLALPSQIHGNNSHFEVLSDSSAHS